MLAFSQAHTSVAVAAFAVAGGAVVLVAAVAFLVAAYKILVVVALGLAVPVFYMKQ